MRCACERFLFKMESFHPILVHFPIALLLAALLIETLGLLFSKQHWHRVSLWNLTLGAAGAAVAVLTGRQAMAVAKHSMEIYRIMELHERLGYGVLALTILIAGCRLLARDRISRKTRWMLWALLAAACGLMAFSAHLGGRMVYEFGVGGSYGHRSGIVIQ